MTRIVTVGAAQLGPIALSDTRAQVVNRMIDLMQQAKGCGCDVLVFPELALTTFFPRWYFDKQDELDAFFETAMPGPDTQRLPWRDLRRLGLGQELLRARPDGRSGPGGRVAGFEGEGCPGVLDRGGGAGGHAQARAGLLHAPRHPRD